MRYFEDFHPGAVEVKEGYLLTQEEMIAFARQYDPQPLHTDPAAAKDLPMGGLIASGSHIMAISVNRLVTGPKPVAIIAGLGWEEVRFLEPARPGDVLTLHHECLEARPSRSKPDRGVVRNRITLLNQHGRVVLRYVDIILVRRRPQP